MTENKANFYNKFSGLYGKLKNVLLGNWSLPFCQHSAMITPFSKINS